MIVKKRFGDKTLKPHAADRYVDPPHLSEAAHERLQMREAMTPTFREFLNFVKAWPTVSMIEANNMPLIPKRAETHFETLRANQPTQWPYRSAGAQIPTISPCTIRRWLYPYQANGAGTPVFAREMSRPRQTEGCGPDEVCRDRSPIRCTAPDLQLADPRHVGNGPYGRRHRLQGAAHAW